MKIGYVLLLSFLYLECPANHIDKLKTIYDVNMFLAKKIDRIYKETPLLEDVSSPDTAKYRKNSFYKIDLDNNHLTDLIIYGANLVIVLDKGTRYELAFIDPNSFMSGSTTLISLQELVLPKKIIIYQNKKPKGVYDTLVYHFNGLIEYNLHTDVPFRFEKIILKTTQCFVPCPIFEMTINSDKTAIYKAIENNKETGEFHGTIPKKVFDEFISLLKYLPIDNLRNEYQVNWSDDQTVTVEIFYNGKSKTISDYGKVGTYGLSNLYSKIFHWRKSILWFE